MLKNKNTFLLLIANVLFISSFAQTAIIGSPTESTNYMQILLIFVSFILMLVIWVLTNVLLMIAKKAVDLSKSTSKLLMIFFIAMGSMFSSNLFAQTASVDEVVSKKPSTEFYGGLSYNTFWTMTSVILLELVVVFVILFYIKSIFRSIYPKTQLVIDGKVDPHSWLLSFWHKLDKHFFTKAISLDHEADLLLDHDYDGIKELDNALPPWWKYGFYITILIAVFYLLKFEVWHTGMNPTEEYKEEMTAAKIQTEAYLASAKENVDENSVVLMDAAGAAAGKALFAKTCAPCHLAEGQGLVGPNLTDDYWIHGGSIKDIFKTIKYGYPDKGMQSWKNTYSSIEIEELDTYIKTLRGTHPPNPKAPQGDLYKEVAASIDSAAIKNK